ncbi:hypothetical protein HDU93_005405 [Gonapodya sp. JEL0774]|nr:hypothetical protein HDU93_005405 [Gonapodya sp. JEL0774]
MKGSIEIHSYRRYNKAAQIVQYTLTDGRAATEGAESISQSPPSQTTDFAAVPASEVTEGVAPTTTESAFNSAAATDVARSANPSSTGISAGAVGGIVAAGLVALVLLTLIGAATWKNQRCSENGETKVRGGASPAQQIRTANNLHDVEHTLLELPGSFPDTLPLALADVRQPPYGALPSPRESAFGSVSDRPPPPRSRIASVREPSFHIEPVNGTSISVDPPYPLIFNPPADGLTYAREEYKAHFAGDLTLKPGNQIALLKSYGDGWAWGKNIDTGEVGMFPEDFLGRGT